MTRHKKQLVRQIEKMTDSQAFAVMGFLYALRIRRFVFTPKAFFLVVNVAQVLLFSVSLYKHPGNLSLIISLAVRVLVVAAIANIPPVFRSQNYSANSG